MSTKSLYPIYSFSEALTPLYVLLILAALVAKPSPYRRLFFAPILFLTYFTIFHTFSGTPSADYGLRLVWLLYFLFASDYILLTDFQRKLHRVPSSPRLSEDSATDSVSITSTSIEERSLWQRVKWALDLFTSPRGINWAHEPRNAISPHPDSSKPRLSFVLQQLLKISLLFVVYDLASLYIHSSPAFEPGEHTGIAALDMQRRFEGVLAWAAVGYAGMAMQHYILGVICVTVHLTGPDEWPAFFGGVRDGWSVRSFWGRGWHQMLRRPLTTHARHLTSALSLPPGSTSARILQLVTIFLISGLMHYAAEAAVTRTWRSTGALVFFLLQPLAIIVEGGVIMLFEPCSVVSESSSDAEHTHTDSAPSRSAWKSRLFTAFGYAWTLSWFALTLPLWQDPLIRAGMMDRGLPVEGSILRAIWLRQENQLPERGI
ncbi:membrane bound O-acyl transferase family-domain-containing protein [Mycena galopus ATCC 62051]|nr:membrane bound O-acyl transferase family-domain-containing protein [Mycena galopus ATCC 62051]